MSELEISTVDEAEIKRFSQLAQSWWNPEGPFRPLHRLNPLRLKYIRKHLCAHFDRDVTSFKPLTGLRLLDIGCGGGLLSEPMARLGAQVVGADALGSNIKIAQLHAQQSQLDIDYLEATAEQLANWGEQFDVILNMEVIEHVSNVDAFAESCAMLLPRNGIMIIATLNRTFLSWAKAIVGAEYILGWLPRGTHDWNKFLKPSELTKSLRAHGLIIDDLRGVSFFPLSNSWNVTNDLSVNYIGVAVKY